ncbi:protein ALTERED XYLOGLUCAN 9-like [Impatiens glandulifera]|uniref:protein ALTERED XYLOGLUCAN 9-like n=1 Tax=Impatiens glandulifera TaxID=253017 RepID=UPI001FB16732|nr:protein ALTERED XYLOGLUCAN 9-like [Impatiens glandulifera]
MLGAVQLGLLAACVVLFVPMGLAGWHLSRNKVLFFSGALFITLAVGVHITPYFSSITSFVSSVSSISATDSRESCISLLHDIVYDVKSIVNTQNISNNNSASWNWEKSSFIDACEFQKLSRSDASDLLNGSWIVVAGDSQARLIAISLLNLVLGQDEMVSVRLDLFKRHSNYQIIIDSIGIKLDFIWAPYSTNLTDFVVDLKRNRIYPDVIVMGAGLWHMLHMTDSSSYGASLVLLRDSVNSLLPFSPEFASGSVSSRSPHIFWIGMPELINSMLNTEEKREKMNDITLLDYEKAVYRSKLLREYGGPLLLLDVKLLSKKCGRLCTVDGMHYNQGVYDAAVHVMLNALLIESHQTL